MIWVERLFEDAQRRGVVVERRVELPCFALRFAQREVADAERRLVRLAPELPYPEGFHRCVLRFLQLTSCEIEIGQARPQLRRPEILRPENLRADGEGAPEVHLGRFVVVQLDAGVPEV